MITIIHDLSRAHNLFGKNGTSGNRAESNNRAFNKVVRQCVKQLVKKGSCLCWYEEQMRDIQNRVDFKTVVEYLEDEIEIRRAK